MDRVFKYRDIDSAGTSNLIEKFELFFNEPCNYNDPFDSFIELDFNGSLKDWESFFIRLKLPPDEISINIDKIQSGI